MTEVPHPEAPEPETLSYARAVEELETILEELEDDNLDVDRLAERVGRAATLIRLCRERISHTRLEVERIVSDLDGAAASSQEGPGPPAPA